MEDQAYNFGDDFSDDILACVVRHQERFAERGYLSIIKPPYFNTLDQIETALGIEDYFIKYARVPAFEVLGQFLFNRYAKRNPDRATALFDYVKKLAALETEDVEYILELTVNFAKERAIYDAVKQVIVAQTDGKKINIIQLFETALKVGTDLNQLGLCFHQDYKAVVDQLTRKEWGVTTGYRLLDEVWPNGWGPGWLISILGPPKRFKTATALNLALNMIRPNIGADVIYFAAEIDEYLAMGRDLCNMTGRTFSDMHKDPDKFVAQVAKQLKIQAAGNLIFRGFPSKTATVQDMELAARNIKSHYELKNLKAIFIDQAETTKPSGNPRDTPEHRRQSDIYTEARAMGTRLGCAIVMPDRCNKETVERPVPSMTSFQGAFEKAGIVDVGIGLCATEEEHMQNVMRIFVFLNRHGEAGHHFKCSVKPAEMQVDVQERIAWSASEAEDEKPRRRKRLTPSPKEVHDRGYNHG